MAAFARQVTYLQMHLEKRMGIRGHSDFVASNVPPILQAVCEAIRRSALRRVCCYVSYSRRQNVRVYH